MTSKSSDTSTSGIDRADPFLLMHKPGILRDSTSFEVLKLITESRETFDDSSKAINRKGPYFTPNLTNLSYKKLQNWEKASLIFPDRNDEAGWRQYSSMDQIWIGIKSLQDCTHLPHSEYPALEFYVIRYQLIGGKSFLLILHDGRAIPLSLHELIDYLQTHDFDFNSYVIIELSMIFLKVLPLQPPVFPQKRKSYVPASLEELVMLNHIRGKNVKSVNVKVKKGKKARNVISELEIAKKFNAAEVRPSELLNDGSDQTVTAIKRRGHVMGYEQLTTLNFSEIEKELENKLGFKHRSE
jgi:hypothetical protein